MEAVAQISLLSGFHWVEAVIPLTFGSLTNVFSGNSVMVLGLSGKITLLCAYSQTSGASFVWILEQGQQTVT